jgi:hypothetical protein
LVAAGCTERASRVAVGCGAFVGTDANDWLVGSSGFGVSITWVGMAVGSGASATAEIVSTGPMPWLTVGTGARLGALMAT